MHVKARPKEDGGGVATRAESSPKFELTPVSYRGHDEAYHDG